MSPNAKLKDGDIELRLISQREATLLFQLVNDNREHLRQWLPWVDDTKTVRDEKKYITRVLKEFKEGLSINLNIYLRETLVGKVELHHINKQHRHAEIGYWMSKEACGKGIMTRAARLLLNYALNRKKLHRIVIRAATGNIKSRAIAERLGLTHEGRQRDAEWLYDHFVDLEMYGILENEFKK